MPPNNVIDLTNLDSSEDESQSEGAATLRAWEPRKQSQATRPIYVYQDGNKRRRVDKAPLEERVPTIASTQPNSSPAPYALDHLYSRQNRDPNRHPASNERTPKLIERNLSLNGAVCFPERQKRFEKDTSYNRQSLNSRSDPLETQTTPPRQQGQEPQNYDASSSPGEVPQRRRPSSIFPDTDVWDLSDTDVEAEQDVNHFRPAEDHVPVTTSPAVEGIDQHVLQTVAGGEPLTARAENEEYEGHQRSSMRRTVTHVSNGSTSIATLIAQNSLTSERLAAAEQLASVSHLPINDQTQTLINLVQQDLQSANPSSIWSPQENALLIHVKEDLNVTWPEVHRRFLSHRGKTWHTCQTHYSQKLAIRSRGGRNRMERAVDAALSSGNETPNRHSLSRRPARRHPLPGSRFAVPTDTTTIFIDRNDDEEFEISQSDIEGPVRHRTLRHTRPTNRSTETSLRRMRVSSTVVHSSKMLHNCLRRYSDERHRTRAALVSGTVKIARGRVIPATLLQKKSLPGRNIHAQLLKRRGVEIQRPYLGQMERQFLKSSIDAGIWDNSEAQLWHDQVLHVDFTTEEVEQLCPFILRGTDFQDLEPPLEPLYSSLRYILQTVDDDRLHNIARYAQSKGGIFNRTIDSLLSFLRDLRDDRHNELISYHRLAQEQPPPKPPMPQVDSFLRSRELRDYRSFAVSTRVPFRIREAVEDTIGPLLSFTGTSGDVNAVAWSPNGERFAAGSAALVDDHSMQYNQRNNLLLGSVTNKTLIELPDHATKRPRTESGVNSLDSMQATQDPLLFQTVSSVQFTADEQAMISTGYDNFARVWDIRGPSATCRWVFKHHAVVDVLAVNSNGLFATGAKRFAEKSVRVIRHDLDCEDPSSLRVFSFCSPKAKNAPQKEIHPTCLRWGDSIYAQQRYLLCGFTSKLRDYGEGETCVWDVEAGQPTAMARGSRAVFDVAWSPSIFGRFAVGSSPAPGSHKTHRETRSVVRIFDSCNLPSGNDEGSSMQIDNRRSYELECPARDMNDVVFNPGDWFLISAGCTDGSTYIWDLRNPNELLQKFSHGPAAMELDSRVEREEADTGVRFVSWGSTRRRLYTGSSDGVVAQWDPYRAPEDAFTRQVVQLNSGVMSGAFSPDFSNLLLGEVNGSVMVLGPGQEEESVRSCKRFSLEKADKATVDRLYEPLGIETTSSDRTQSESMSAARELIDAGKIVIRPFGDLPFRQAVQGPNYDGPYDESAGAHSLRSESKAFQELFMKSEAFRPQNRAEDAELVTEEEKGDSEAWRGRIPEAFRFDKNGRLASKSREQLTCLRCTEKLHVSCDDTDIVGCTRCKQTWRVDLLGYSRMPELQCRGDAVGCIVATGSTTEGMDLGGAPQGEVEDGTDELQDLETYFHNLWQDRSDSTA